MAEEVENGLMKYPSVEECSMQDLQQENVKLRQQLRRALTSELRMVETSRLLATDVARLRRQLKHQSNSEPPSPSQSRAPFSLNGKF